MLGWVVVKSGFWQLQKLLQTKSTQQVFDCNVKDLLYTCTVAVHRSAALSYYNISE